MKTWIPLKRNLCRSMIAFVLAMTALISGGWLATSLAYAEPSADQGAAFEQYASDRTPTGSSVGWGSLYVDKSYDGSPLSLLVDGQEKTFDHGFWAHADSSIYFNDIQEYGYERFEAWVGISHTARTPGKSAAVVFKVIADGKQIWESDVMTERSDAVQVSLDISQYKVIQLVAQAADKGAHPNNHAVWADAKFSKGEPTPWLSVSDKEFSNPEQVTPANILEGVFARTLSGPVGETDKPVVGSDGTLHNGTEGNDLSGDVTYTTDYVPGKTGKFTIDYSVKDAQGYTRTRSVTMTVMSEEVYRTNANIDYLTTPFASFLYAGRDYFDEQGKAAFDLSVEKLLSFGKDVSSYELVNHWGEDVYKVTIDLQAAGIYMSTADAGYLTSTIMDCEPRTFHVKDWGTGVTSKDGIADTVTYYVAKRYGQVDSSGQVYYHTRLLQAEANASRFLDNIQNGMTDSQRLRAVLYPYADWISYSGGGQVMDEALAGGAAVCGGNARGSIYLSQRMGIKAYWVRTDSHAWSNVKLNRDDSGISTEGTYYRIDLLARNGCFLSIDAEHEGFHGHHKELYFDRMKGYPNMVSESYPFAWTAWPNVTMNAEDSWIVLTPEDAATFDATKLIQSASSIYDGDLKKSVSIDYGGLVKNADGQFKPGYYELTFTATDSRGNKATDTVNVQVVGGEIIKANAENCSENINSTFLPDSGGNLPSLWNGSGEVVYSYGIAQNDGGKSVSYEVDRGDGVRLTYLDAWVGLHKSTRDSQWGGNGKVRFVVKALVDNGGSQPEEVVLYTSPDMTRYTVQEHVLVKIPDNAVTVTLTSESLGAGNGHARWGNPRFFTDEVLDKVPVAPVIANVEDGATYKDKVTPIVEGATSVSLYHKNLPVIIDPDTGEVETGSGDASAENGGDSAANVNARSAMYAAASEENWGTLVEGYKPGDPITDEGVYTLVAENKYGQRTIVTFTVEKELSRISVPNSIGNLTYTGEVQIGVPAGEGYTLSNATNGASIDGSGNAVATEVGSYSVVASLKAGYVWADGSKDPVTIEFAIDPKAPEPGVDEGDGGDSGSGDSGGGDDTGDGGNGDGNTDGDGNTGDGNTGNGNTGGDGNNDDGGNTENGNDNGNGSGGNDDNGDNDQGDNGDQGGNNNNNQDNGSGNGGNTGDDTDDNQSPNDSQDPVDPQDPAPSDPQQPGDQNGSASDANDKGGKDASGIPSTGDPVKGVVMMLGAAVLVSAIAALVASSRRKRFLYRK